MRLDSAVLPVAIALLFVSACFLTDPENIPPAVTITQPAGLHVVNLGEVVEIVAEASDSDGVVVSVSFRVNGRLVGRDFDSPYSVTWNTADAERWSNRLTVTAEDDSRATGDDRLTVRTNWVYGPPQQTDDGWETASLSEVGMDPARLEDMMNTLRDHPRHMVHGIVVARHGTLVFEQYFEGLTHPTWGENPVVFGIDTPHVLSSVTKSFTATMLGIAIDRGFISNVNEKVFDYYPELAALSTSGKQDITLEHLVTMSAGLAWNESSTTLRDPGNDLTAMIRLAMTTGDDIVHFILAKPLERTPGTYFLYSGGLTNVLGDVIGRASGQLLDEFSNEYLFSPLDIDRFWWWLLRPDFVYASGDLALRPRDMVRFGQLFLQNGRWNGVQIVSEEWVTLSATPQFEFTEPHWALTYGHRGYSYGWWPSSEEYGEGAYAASGWGGQAIIVMPEYDMVVAVTGGYYWDTPFLTYNQLMTNYVLPAIR